MFKDFFFKLNKGPIEINWFPMKNQIGCTVFVNHVQNRESESNGQGDGGRMALALACSFWAHVPTSLVVYEFMSQSKALFSSQNFSRFSVTSNLAAHT